MIAESQLFTFIAAVIADRGVHAHFFPSPQRFLFPRVPNIF